MSNAGTATFRYNLTQDYLEVARAALTTIHGKLPDKDKDPASDALANAIFSVVSITVVYSFLALESFLNYELYLLWERRTDGSPESERFLAELGDEPNFKRLKENDKIREVPTRLRTLCRLLGHPEPHKAIADTWHRLGQLVDTSRHFVVHPIPDPNYFNKNMKRIMEGTKSGAYVRVAEEVMSFLYVQSGKVIPPWVKSNQLMRFRGVELLPSADVE